MTNHSENKGGKTKTEKRFYSRLKYKAKRYYSREKRYKRKYCKCINFTLIKDVALIVLAYFTIRVGCQQNNISEKSVRVSNRPYLVVDKINYSNEFLIANYGKTPSFKTKIFYDTKIDSSENFVPPEVYKDSIVTYSTIGPTSGIWIEMPTKPIVHPNFNNFVYCYGKIVYSDIFDDWHGYKFCFSSDGSWQKYKEHNYQFEIN